MERTWYNRKIANSKAKEFMDKYPTFDIDRFIDIAKNGEYEEFRLLCNAIAYSMCGNNDYFSTNFAEKRSIIAACNDRVNRILGKNAVIYDELVESQRHELWLGDERYRLFGYDFASYADRQIILSLVELIVGYIGKPINAEDISAISFLYRHGRIPELYKERDSYDYDWEHSDRDFEYLNKGRQTHIERWNSFMKHIFDGNYDKAYMLIKQYDEEIKTGDKTNERNYYNRIN